MKQLSTYFVRGLIYLTPIAATIYIIYRIVVFLDNLLVFETPGVSLALVLMSIVVLGFVGTLVISSPVIKYSEKLLVRIPLVNILYTSTKDLVQSFSGEKSKFNVPVMVRFDKNLDIYKPGFVTSENLESIQMNGMVAVYLPMSYAFSGNVFVVPAENVRNIDVPAVDYMKFIVSGGVSGLGD